jgi:hypothetical protein
MLDFLSDNIWFTIISVGIIAIQSVFILSHQKHLHNLIQSFKALDAYLEEEGVEITKNFNKIQGDIDVVSREISHAIALSERSKKKTSLPKGKKAEKFLTISGKIRKQYRDNPIAQKCYEKFHRLQNI